MAHSRLASELVTCSILFHTSIHCNIMEYHPKCLLTFHFLVTGWWDVVGSHKVPQIICIKKSLLPDSARSKFLFTSSWDMLGPLRLPRAMHSGVEETQLSCKEKCPIFGASQLDGSGCLRGLMQYCCRPYILDDIG